MGFNSVTITPTLDTSEYEDGDVLFVGTELKMPRRGCKLIAVQAVWNDTEAFNDRVGLYFFAENNTALGTINSAPGISAANIHGNGFLGYTKISSDDVVENHLGTPTILTSNGMIGAAEAVHNAVLPIVLVAGKGTDSHHSSIFVQGILEATANITCAADSLKLVFHFEF